MSLSELNAFFYRLAVSRVCARDISGSLNLEPTERLCFKRCICA